MSKRHLKVRSCTIFVSSGTIFEAFKFISLGLFALLFCSPFFIFPRTAHAQSDSILLNEIYPCPNTGEKEWIELYNPANTTVSLDNYTLEDNTGSKYQKMLTGYSIGPMSQLLVQGSGVDFNFQLNNSGDILILKNDDITIDQVAYGDYDDGSLADNAPAPPKGKSISRRIDISSGINANDFKIMPPTPDAPNLEIKYSNSIEITEVLADPIDGSKNEFIELFNSSQEVVNLAGWQLDDGDGGSSAYKIPNLSVINPGQYLSFYNYTTSITLNDTKDAARLFDPNGQIRSQVYYDKPTKGQSYCQTVVWQQCSPTASASNLAVTKSENAGNETELASSEVVSDPVTISGTVTAPPGVLSDYYGYFQGDDFSIQFYSSTKNFPNLLPGDKIEVVGTISVANGEKRLKISAQNGITILGTGLLPPPLQLSQYNEDKVGRLVAVEGKLIEKESDDLLIVLESGDQIAVKGEFDYPKRKIKIGDTISAEGILSVYRGKVRILLLARDSVKVNNLRELPASGPSGLIYLPFFTLILFSVWFIKRKA